MSRIKLNDIAKKAGVSISTVSRALNRPEMVKKSTRDKVLKVVKEMGYKPKVSRRTTLNDIAKLTGVSRATVSRTLNHPDKVKVSTRNKVLKAIKKMGYKPKVRKDGLVSRRTTLNDIAKLTGVSRSTVSRTLNHPDKVKVSTRNKVLKVVKEMGYKPKVRKDGLVSRRTSKITLRYIAKVAGVSVSTVSRTLNNPEKVRVSTRNKVLKVINEINYKPVNITEKYLEYKNYMAKKPNDTVLSRWGMYTHDDRYKDYTASIVNMIMKDMNINSDQAYYMLYYMVSNDIDDYERAKRDMMVDPNFEIYRDKRNKRR